MRHATGEGRTVLHALPVSYALDGVKGIRDPRGMVARKFGVDMNVVTSDATVARNLMLVVERCHLNVEAMAASPYVAGLSVLTDDEADLGAAVIEMGAGASQLVGLVGLATQVLGRPVRIGRPLRFGRLPNEAKSASFAVPTGLLVYPQYAHLEHVEPRHPRQLRTGTDGYFGKVGRWLREGF